MIRRATVDMATSMARVPSSMLKVVIVSVLSLCDVGWSQERPCTVPEYSLPVKHPLSKTLISPLCYLNRRKELDLLNT